MVGMHEEFGCEDGQIALQRVHRSPQDVEFHALDVKVRKSQGLATPLTLEQRVKLPHVEIYIRPVRTVFEISTCSPGFGQTVGTLRTLRCVHLSEVAHAFAWDDDLFVKAQPGLDWSDVADLRGQRIRNVDEVASHRFHGVNHSRR